MNQFCSQEDNIETPYGDVHVRVQGSRGKPAIMTCHDIGLNSKIIDRLEIQHAKGNRDNCLSLNFLRYLLQPFLCLKVKVSPQIESTRFVLKYLCMDRTSCGY